MTKRTIEIKNVDPDDKPDSGNGTPIADETEEKQDIPVNPTATREDTPADEAEPPEEVEEAPPEPTVEEKLAEMTDRLLRLAAEFENYKKKNAREYDRGHQAGSAGIIERIIPVLDSFDSARQTAAGDEGMMEGFQKIHRQMIEALTGAGMEIIEPERGTPLDPHVHEVLMTLPTLEAPEDTIYALFQRGYSFNGRLVRPAKVQVAKKPEA